MSKKSEVTAKTFTSVLSGVVRNFGNVRDRIQDLLAFAMVQASKDNFTYVNQIINAKLTGLNRAGLQKYIEDFCDLQLIKEDGAYKFKSQKTKGFAFVMPTETWYEHGPQPEPKVIEAPETVMALIVRISRAIKGDGKTKVAQGHVKEAKAMLAYLKKAPGLDKAKLAALEA